MGAAEFSWFILTSYFVLKMFRPDPDSENIGRGIVLQMPDTWACGLGRRRVQLADSPVSFQESTQGDNYLLHPSIISAGVALTMWNTIEILALQDHADLTMLSNAYLCISVCGLVCDPGTKSAKSVYTVFMSKKVYRAQHALGEKWHANVHLSMKRTRFKERWCKSADKH